MVGAELTKILHLSEPEEAMATNPTEFPRLNAELVTEATDVSLNWFRPIAEQNLKQSCGSLREVLNVTRRMIGEFDNQASAFCEHSISLAEETIANTFECGVKLLRVREPQELAQIQTDFLSRQAQAIANHTKEFNECFVKGAEQLANTAAGSARKAA
jgi:hypothetical protein